MREILFRGKTFDGKWIEGFVFQEVGDCVVRWCISTTPICANDYSEILGDYAEVLPDTVGQYTGLTDKNGKKIFEGDILKGAWDTIFQVVYDDCYLGFRAKEKDGMHNCIDYYGLDRIEVIGNIHDNPELLKGGEQE